MKSYNDDYDYFVNIDIENFIERYDDCNNPVYHTKYKPITNHEISYIEMYVSKPSYNYVEDTDEDTEHYSIGIKKIISHTFSLTVLGLVMYILL
jgi:hypothetical protein